ncbi:MAG: hypothetical protein QNJ55_33060 [Xenococcus sp. MO_188.B8]|nr:hypothetical protein [Xenococcus sp. MO_188.B8]
MNLPIIVDVVISLVFVYLILSLLAAEIQELIATIFQWRAKHLKESIINLLSGDTTSENSIVQSQKLAQQLYSHPLLNSVNQEARGLFAILFRRITWIFSSGYQVILGKDNNLGERKTAPSYIAPETFATALLEQLGVIKYAERLYEVKFHKFQDLVIGKLTEPNGQQEEAIKELQQEFAKITDQFDRKTITLETAINNTSLEVKSYIEKMPDPDLKKKLRTWQEIFFGAKNELATINGGIKPTLQEITDSMNTASRTYQEYRQELNKYKKERNQEAAEELEKFLRFLHQSLDGLSPGLNKLLGEDNSDFIKVEQSDSKSKDPKIPLYQVDDKITDKISDSLAEFKHNNAEHKQKITRLEAFQEGFLGQDRVLKSKETCIIFQTISIIIVFVLFTLWLLTSKPIWIAGYTGGIFLLVLWLLGFPIVILWLLKKLFKSNSAQDSIGRETLARLLDRYLIVFQSDPDSSTDSDAFQTALNEYLKKVEARVTKLTETKNGAKAQSNQDKLEEEIRDLGRSFRRYHQRLVLDFADVDLPFIPSSVKENISLLAKKSKFKADKLENQITQLGQEVGKWFDDSMERSVGVYKRNAKGISILIGFLIAVITNANSIYMIDRLSFDQELRQVMISSSEQLISEVEPSESLTKAEIRELNQKYADIFHNINLPIGWDVVLFSHQVGCEISLSQKPESNSQKQDDTNVSPDLDSTSASQEDQSQIPSEAKKDGDNLTWKQLFDYCLPNNQENKPDNYFVPTSIMLIFLTNHKYWLACTFIIGWLLTGFAIAMGASFWFDLLGKLVNVRNTGVKQPTGVQKSSASQSTTTTSSSQ